MNQVYEEVYNFISYLGPDYKNQLPEKLLLFLEKYKSNNSFDTSTPLEELSLSREAIVLLSVIHVNYWVKDENQKKELIKMYSDNEKEFQEKINQYKNADWLNIQNQSTETEEIIEEESTDNAQDVDIIPRHENIADKIINFFKNKIKDMLWKNH